MDYSNLFEAPRLRRERRQAQPSRPMVIRECICRNGHMPDQDGWVSTDPNCLRHGRRLPHSTRAPSREEKSVVEAAIARQREIVVMQQMRKAKRAAALRERADRKRL